MEIWEKINRYYYCSVGLAVDNPELFNRISEAFQSKANMRFVILLWGDKSSLPSGGVKGIPVFNYKDIISLGQESRNAISNSNDVSKSISWLSVFHCVYCHLQCSCVCSCVWSLSEIFLVLLHVQDPQFYLLFRWANV